jgi:glutaminyl-tRNA synthetase
VSRSVFISRSKFLPLKSTHSSFLLPFPLSHSLCTTEFINSRESYDWLCDALEIYKPRQSEYGRLNIQGTVMSKRKIKKLVDDKHVSGWDDPRIYTLIALRRRGIPPGAIISFIQSLGVSTASSNIQLVKFEASIRAYLESSAPRLMLVLQPLKVTIENVGEDYRVVCEKPLHPKIPSFGVAQIAVTKTVGLFSAPHPVTCTEVVKDGEGNIVEVIVKLETEMTKKPKAYIRQS